MDVSNFNNTDTRMTVYTYNSNGEFIKEYSTLSDAAKAYNTSLGVIQRAIKGQTKVRNNYFSLEKLDSFKKKIVQRHYGDPIHQYSLSGEYIKTFNSVKEVVQQLGKKYSKIPTYIRTQSTCGGYQ